MSVVTAALLAGGASACSGPAPKAPAPATVSPSGNAADLDAVRASLAAHAALAQDHHFAALYRYEVPGQSPRNVVATVADDGSWRVDVAGALLGGSTDGAIVSLPTGMFQCTLSSAANPISPSCVKVAAAGKRVPKANDPTIERVFRQWLTVFTDRQSALSVALAQPLRGSRGTCFSIDSISASMNAPVDVGIYCYDDEGLLTAAKVLAGTITITSTPVAPPARVQLPGPVVDGPAPGLDAPPPPPAPSPSVSGSAPSP
jgi:hypothetical protein